MLKSKNLICLEALNWIKSDDFFTISIDLPKDFLTARHITPCFSAVGCGAYAYQFSLQGRYLTPVGDPEFFDQFEQDIVSDIDTFQNPASGKLVLTVLPFDPERFQAARCLVSLSAHIGGVKGDIPESVNVPVTPYSQMEQDEKIASRVCSPTCVAMVLDQEPQDVARLSYHPMYDLYGVWPQNIYAASQFGTLGYLHHFETLPLSVPVIASVAYEKGELKGAAIEETKGHLVVIYGYKNGQVLVYDPAAQNTETVSRNYDVREFTRAWSNRLGLGYVMIRA